VRIFTFGRTAAIVRMILPRSFVVTAANAIVTNNGASIVGAGGGRRTIFFGTSTARNADHYQQWRNCHRRTGRLHCQVREQNDRMPPSVKYWEIIADNLSKAGWSWGSISAIGSNGRTIWIADAHRGDGKRFVSDAEEKLRAFLELESAIRAAECPENLCLP